MGFSCRLTFFKYPNKRQALFVTRNWGNACHKGYEFDILFWAIAAVLAVNGSGKFSIDRWLYKRNISVAAPVIVQQVFSS